MQLSEHFTLEEFTRSMTADRLNINNVPPAKVLANLRRLAERMEKVRVILRYRPIVISSGYRCPQLNSVIGGARGSKHQFGLAADFSAIGINNLHAFTVLQSETSWIDQLILEYYNPPSKPGWLHLAIEEEGKDPRGQAFKIGS